MMNILGVKEREKLINLQNELQKYLVSISKTTRVKGYNGLTILRPSENVYCGIWPDDFLFPQIVCPGIITKDELFETIVFLTHSITKLQVVPDRVEPDGLPIMQPGWYDSPHSYRMPLHLPAAWMRLISYAEEWGIEIPQKDSWARIIKKSFDDVPFSCGLAYVDPQRPYIGFGFFDPN